MKTEKIIALKVLELMKKATVERIQNGYSSDFKYGNLYLRVVGSVYNESGPFWIDVQFHENTIGRLQKIEPNKFYPSNDDQEKIEVTALFNQIVERCKSDHEKEESKKETNALNDFMSA